MIVVWTQALAGAVEREENLLLLGLAGEGALAAARALRQARVAGLAAPTVSVAVHDDAASDVHADGRHVHAVHGDRRGRAL